MFYFSLYQGSEAKSAIELKAAALCCAEQQTAASLPLDSGTGGGCLDR
jgi:hypothetical protein